MEYSLWQRDVTIPSVWKRRWIGPLAQIENIEESAAALNPYLEFVILPSAEKPVEMEEV